MHEEHSDEYLLSGLQAAKPPQAEGWRAVAEGQTELF